MSASFAEIALGEFIFLLQGRGFMGPEVGDAAIFYYSPAVSIEILYDSRSKYVQTFVTGLVRERYLRAELSCLYVTAGLGPAQDIGWSAGKVHALEKSLRSQARALRTLLPMLKRGGRRDELLVGCHGR